MKKLLCAVALCLPLTAFAEFRIWYQPGEGNDYNKPSLVVCHQLSQRCLELTHDEQLDVFETYLEQLDKFKAKEKENI